MTTRRRDNLIRLASALVGAGIVLGLVQFASAGPPDPVVAFDHADRTVTTSSAPDVPVLAFRPTRTAQFRAFAHRVGENTGGAWLAAIVAICIRRARSRWPRLRRGWTDEATATAFAAAAWVAGSLATGATWATAALGVLMAALAGGLIAMIPGEKPAAGGAA